MIRLIGLMGLALTCLVQGCSTQPPPRADGAQVNAATAIGFCPAGDCASQPKDAVNGVAVGLERNAPLVDGRPLSAVVVTQCNLVVAVYMTMPDGRLLRFDQTANVPAEQLVSIAYTASRSERVEVSCNGAGPVGFEKHEAV